jgi:hypothetical protein
LFIAVIISFTGCYTIVWSPDTEFPTEKNYNNNDGYYPDYYYGDYYYFYDYPWWFNITPPIYIDKTKERTVVRDQSDSHLRNNDSGRRTDSGRKEIIQTNTPTRDGNKNSDNDNNSSSSSNNDSVDRQSSSNNNSGNTQNTNTSRSSDNSSNNTRNNDGGRNTGGRR